MPNDVVRLIMSGIDDRLSPRRLIRCSHARPDGMNHSGKMLNRAMWTRGNTEQERICFGNMSSPYLAPSFKSLLGGLHSGHQCDRKELKE